MKPSKTDAEKLADELDMLWHEDSAARVAIDSAAIELRRLQAENDALRRGEFICQRCGLRKDAEQSGRAPF